MKDSQISICPNTIYHMECLEGMTHMAERSAEMILCDLPYGVTARNKWDVVISLEPLWEQYKRIIMRWSWLVGQKNGGP